MKAIMISIKPEWVRQILNGEKTIEIRKTMPKCDLPIDVYIYCTKGKPRIVDLRDDAFYLGCSPRLNGKVVAKFTLNKVEKFTNDDLWAKCFKTDELIAKSCVRFSQITAYSCASSIYAWHIDNLVIFDKPKELSEFHLWEKDKIIRLIVNNTSKLAGECLWKPLTKAPQSFMYIDID